MPPGRYLRPRFSPPVPAMKTTTIATPLALLLAAGVWISTQRHAIGKLEQQNHRLQQQLATGTGETASPPKHPTPKTALDRVVINWQEVTRQVRGNMGGHGYLKTTRRLDEGFRSMTLDQLIAALDEIEAAELSRNDLQMLEQIIRSAIFTNHPEEGLTHFIHLYGDQGWDYSMASGFAGWAKQNPDKAIAWFDEQLAAGAFDRDHTSGAFSKPVGLVREAFFALLGPTPDGAGHLLAAIPEGIRLGTLGSIHITSLNEKTHGAWADLVREHLSASEQLKAISWPTQNWSDGDGASMNLSQVSAYLNRISATEAELKSCLLCAAGEAGSWRTRGPDRKSAAEDLDALRRWVGESMPKLVDPATAKALAAIRAPYPELAEIAMDYHRTSGNDALLIPLLDRHDARDNRPLARRIARQLSDETSRNEYLERFQSVPTGP